MRLCFVAPGYPPDRGGAEEYVRAMAERFAKKGHEVHVLAPAWEGHGTEEERNGVRVHRLAAVGFGWLSKRLAWLGGLEETLRKMDPDLVHVQSHASLYAWQAAEACRRRGKKFTVLTYGPTVEHNPGSVLRDLFADGVDAWTAPTIFPRAALVLYRTENLVPWCKEQGARKLLQAPTGIDEAFLEAPADGKWKAGKKKVIGFVGGLSARKGCGPLLRALPQVLEKEPEALLVFVGGEAEKGMGRRLAGEAAKLGVSHAVMFVGHLDGASDAGQRKLIAWLDSLDVFCLPSAWEGPSQAMLQAMARSKPVVVARIPQLENLVDNENGALVEFGDVEGLARALTDLLGDAKKRERMGKLNRAGAANFTFNRLADELERAYLKLV